MYINTPVELFPFVFFFLSSFPGQEEGEEDEAVSGREEITEAKIMWKREVPLFASPPFPVAYVEVG